MTSADSCRMGGIEDVGTVGLEYVGRLLRYFFWLKKVLQKQTLYFSMMPFSLIFFLTKKRLRKVLQE